MTVVVVVGASVAGLSACEGLRESGYDGEIVLLGAESSAPYDRPPLSKGVLTHGLGGEDIRLTSPDSLGVSFRHGTSATGLDLAAHRVVLDGDPAVKFDGLIVATGSRARSLPGLDDVSGVGSLRTLEDAIALRNALLPGTEVVVVGAGFIGLEVASAAAEMGCRVTVLESAPQPMSRVLPASLGALFVALHGRAGVAVRCGAHFDHVIVDRGRVTGVRLADATALSADLVVLGLGAVPNTDWLDGSGLNVLDGVRCDAALRAGDRVYACGDVARWPHPRFGSLRVEHWTTAVQHGRTAGRNLTADLTGDRTPRQTADEIPYFWSDQCGLKLQLAGWAPGADELHALVDGHRFVVLFGRDGQLSAALAGGWPRLLGGLRRAISEGATFRDTVAQLPIPQADPDPVIAQALDLDIVERL